MRNGALTVDTTDILNNIATSTGTDSTTSGTLSLTNDASSLTSVRMSAISDGTSNTIAVIEDAGRVSPLSYNKGYAPYYCLSTYTDLTGGTVSQLPDDVTGDATGATTGNTAHGVWRWADSDACGSGISGPFGDNATAAGVTAWGSSNTGQVINQNSYPIGGVATATPSAAGVKGAQGTNCSWTQNNCGANDEPFAFHNGGCNCVMVDGSVRFLSDKLDPVTLRRLVTRSEGVPIDNADAVFSQ